MPALVEKLQGRAPTCARWSRPAALANARDVRRPGLRRLPHLHGPGARPTRWRGAARGPAGRCRCSRCSTATPPTSRRSGGRKHEVLHPVEPAAAARRARPPGRRSARPTRKDDLDDGRTASSPRSRRAARGRVQRPPVLVAGRGRTSTASCSPGGPGRCWTSPARSTPTRCCASRCGSACTRSENRRHDAGRRSRPLLPKLLDQYKLLGQDARHASGRRRLDREAGQDDLRRRPRRGRRGGRRGAGRGDLARRPSARRSSLAANQLVLRDPGRPAGGPAGKPGAASTAIRSGVHASDAANAWRNIARVSNQRNTVASLIVGGVPHGRPDTAANCSEPVPAARAPGEGARRPTRRRCSNETEAAVKASDQALRLRARRAATASWAARPGRCSTCCSGTRVSEDGALHAEKYYRTVTEEFASSRPAFRWRQLAALARVTASEYGKPAPGMDEARRLLGVG